MRIVIIGAGEIGFRVAQRLSTENKDVVIIDKNPDAIKRINDHLDVQTILGSGSSPVLLEQAGLQKAELFLAVTDSDETNLTACLFARALAPNITKLARIRNQEYMHFKSALTREIVNIAHVINPDQEVVHSLERMVEVPGALEVNQFAAGRVSLVGVRVCPESPLLGIRLMDVPERYRDDRFIVAALIRGEKLVIPTGKDDIHEEDIIYFICESEQVNNVMPLFNPCTKKIRQIMIIGGGSVGLLAARRLEKKGLSVKLVDMDLERCRFLAGELDQTVVLHGDGSEVDLLQEENIQDMDALLALTSSEETNILISLLAKSLGVDKTITRINKFTYVPLARAIGLENVISQRIAAVSTILRHVRRGKVISSVPIKGEEAEALEAVALENSSIVNKPIKDLHFPKGALILCVIRGEDVHIPTGETIILPQDRIIILSTRRTIERVERSLAVKLKYF
ncbi:trk system potassium uptake protein TrkA [Desulfonatronum thiosulfatophilum]|uniref:Trk system potassium uptake protein TrkA n=1 Tax=Desulfonatronum thiosulfatophilum TaxID=617002 RepID=A0A1G6AI07_9BACT|nr:Trk system potassium transporter TrkA [Desulfonatronum thiosulfatophilum]SDB08058.1 trk system potassium uptake protein TrkA [Desulfonatronum thiosulfatophilum]